MKSLFKRIWNDKRGNVLVIAGASLPLLVGSAGLATDTIQWTLAKRQLQRTADSAALAGVHHIIQGQTASTGVDRDITHNNHTGLTLGTPVVSHPATGFATDPNSVGVTLSVTKPLSFSGMFMTTTPTITATAVASVVQAGEYCVISLESTTTSGLEVSGSATVNLGCGMATNSRGSNAIDASGASKVTASPVSAVGAIPDNGNFAVGTTIQSYGMKQDDPYENLAMPSIPNGTCHNVQLSGGKDYTDLIPKNGQRPDYLSANNKLRTDVCYNSLKLGGTIEFEPGTVVLNGGDLDLGSQANVTATNNTFYFTSSKGTINSSNDIGGPRINASAQINFAAPTSGTYDGILMLQDRRALDGNSVQNKINGNSSSFMQGSIYFPSQEVVFNGGSGMNTDCVFMVVRRLEFSGNSTLKNDCPLGTNLGGFDGSMIRLIA